MHKKIWRAVVLHLAVFVGAAIVVNFSPKVENSPEVEKMETEAIPGTIEFYRDFDFLQEYEAEELTADILNNRNGSLIIEKCIGRVTSENGDGEILNGNGYISYAGINAKKGNVILTYFVYNPDSNFEDDIISRFDYIIDTITY